MSSRWLSSHRNACHSRVYTVKSSSAGRGGTANHILAAGRHSPKRPHLLFLTLNLLTTLQTHSHRRVCSRVYQRTCKFNHTKNIRVMCSRLMEADVHSKVCSRYRLTLKLADCSHVSQLALKLLFPTYEWIIQSRIRSTYWELIILGTRLLD